MASKEGWNIWFAGACAGLSINLLVFPLDTLKTRIQSPSYRQIFRSTNAIASRALYRGLYQGVGTVALIAMPSSGVFFTTYEGLKHALAATGMPSTAIHVFSSGTAQLLTSAVVTPVEVLKQNAQVLVREDGNRKTSSPTMEVMRQLVKHPAKLWRGYTALVARDLPFAVLQFPAYEQVKRMLTARSLDRKGGVSVSPTLERARISAVSASVAGCVAAWATTPFDVVKTRMMLESGAKAQDGFAVRGMRAARDSGASRGRVLRIGRDILRNEGVRGLFRGGLARATLTIVGNGLYMGCYEGVRYHLAEKE